MRKLVLFLVVVGLLVGVVAGGEGKKGPIDVTNESWKSISGTPEKWKDIRVTDKSTDMRMYKIEDIGGNIKISKKEGLSKSSVKVQVKIPEKVIKGLPGYDGEKFAVLHIGEDGRAEYRVVRTKDVKDKSGNVVFGTEMSTTVVGGAIGYWVKNFSESLFDTEIDFHGEGVTAVTVNITSPPAYGKEIDYVPGTNNTMPISGGVAWWRFDEGTGTTSADDIGSNDMVLYNTPTWVNGAPGTYGKSLRFDTSNTEYAMADELTAVDRTKNFTVVALINGTDTAYSSTSKKVYASGISTSNRFTMVIRSGYLIAGVWDGSSYLYRKQVDISDNVPYFVAAVYTYSGGVGSFDLYANDLVDASSTLSIHSDYGVTYVRPFNTGEDNVIVFNRALSQEEVMNLRRGFSGIRAYTYPGGNATPIQSSSQSIVSEDSLDYIKFNSSYSGSYSGSIVGYFQQNYTLVNEYDNASHHRVDILYSPLSNVTDGELVYELSSVAGLGAPVLSTNQTGASVSLSGNNITVSLGDMDEGDTRYFNVGLPIVGANIIDYTPEELSVSLYHEQPQNFTVETDGETDIEWLLDSVVVDYDNTTTNGSYQLMSGDTGSHNVTAKIEGDQVSWDVAIQPNNFAGYTPEDLTPKAMNGTPLNFSLEVEYPETVNWLLNGSSVQMNDTVTNASYVFEDTGTGFYNLTAKIMDEQIVWLIEVGIPAIDGYVPEDLTPEGTVGTSKLFSISTDWIDDVEWLVDGAVQNTSLNTTNSVYMFLTNVSGNYNVTGRTTHEQKSWNLTILPLNISDWSPVNMTSSTKNGTPMVFNVSLLGVGDVEWLVNNTTKKIDNDAGSSIYTFEDSGIGSYNVTGRIEGAQKVWIVEVLPRTIDSWGPVSSDFSVTEGNSVEFNVTCSDPSTVWWYVDGELVQTNGSSILAEYVYEDEVGLHNVTALIDDDRQTWNITYVYKSIVGYSPVDSDISVDIIDDIDMQAILDGIDNVYWYINGTLVKSDIGVTQSNYTFYKGISGYYNVTAISTHDSKTWVVYVLPNSFADFYPSDLTPTWVENSSQLFNVTLQTNGTVDWLLNGTVVQSNSSSITAAYILDEKADIYNVTARTDGNQIVWLANITETRWDHWMKWDGNIFDWYYQEPDDSQYADDLEVGQ